MTPLWDREPLEYSARKLDRQFIGAEINPEHFKNAQKLISAKHSEIKTKKHDRKKYNDEYKNTNRKQLNKKEAQRMREKREFVKKIKPLFELEKSLLNHLQNSTTERETKLGVPNDSTYPVKPYFHRKRRKYNKDNPTDSSKPTR